MIEMIKENPRVRTLEVNLKIQDIVNLDFRKFIGIHAHLRRSIKFVFSDLI